MIGGKLTVVPIHPGDKHDTDLSVIEAMLGKLATDDTVPVATTLGAAPKVPEPNADDSNLQDVTKRVVGLEQSTEAMAQQMRLETEALQKLRAQSAAENASLMKALEDRTEHVLDQAIDATHSVLTHTKPTLPTGSKEVGSH